MKGVCSGKLIVIRKRSPQNPSGGRSARWRLNKSEIKNTFIDSEIIRKQYHLGDNWLKKEHIHYMDKGL